MNTYTYPDTCASMPVPVYEYVLLSLITLLFVIVVVLFKLNSESADRIKQLRWARQLRRDHQGQYTKRLSGEVKEMKEACAILSAELLDMQQVIREKDDLIHQQADAMREMLEVEEQLQQLQGLTLKVDNVAEDTHEPFHF